MEHKQRIEHYPDNKKLAEAIGNLRYDALADLFNELRLKFSKDSIDDAKRHRPKLSSELSQIAARMRNAQRLAEKSWEICEAYMIKQEYVGWIVDIDEEEKKLYLELRKKEDSASTDFIYTCVISFDDLTPDDQKLISKGHCFTLIQEGDNRIIEMMKSEPFTEEEIKKIKERAAEMAKNLRWD